VSAPRPRVVDGVTRGELSAEEVVVSLRGGDRALILNAVGDAVLDLCDGSRTVGEIAAFLRDHMSVPANADVAGDVTAVIDELVRAGLVETVER
jgi:hypothetical protein